MLDSVLIDKKCQELLNHWMIDNALAWWQDIEANLGDELVEVDFVPDTTQSIMRNQFRDFYQGGICVQSFVRRFGE